MTQVAAAVNRDLKCVVVEMATVAPPTIVWEVPASKVIAPEEEPRFMMYQSKDWLIAIALNPPDISVPVGRVRETAAVDVVVMMTVSS